MKRRVLIGLSIILLIFFLGGLLIVFSLETSRAKYNRLITLHQAQILRDNLLLNLQKVQTDLYQFRMHRRHGRQDRETIMRDASTLGTTIDHCFTCHHSEALVKQLQQSKGMIAVYQDGISRILRASSDQDTDRIEDETISHGKVILSMFSDIVTTANRHLSARTGEVFQYTNTIEIILYTCLFLGLGVAVLVAIAFEKQLLKPVQEILDGADNFSKGNLDYRIPTEMPRELSMIAQSFNKMSVDLKEKIEKTRKAEQSELMREVAAGLAHEIKNPLAGIRGALEIFMTELSLTKEDKAVFEEMLFQVKKLDILTKCFLEYARPPSPQFIPTSVNEILNNTIGFLTKHNLHKNLDKVEISRELAEDLPVVGVDPIQLQQIIMNLVFNALDAMPSGGKITFRTMDAGDAIEISVSDTGHGMDREVAENVFKPFFTTKSKGMGIGLSICKRLVEQHNGTISVSSSEAGTTFAIRLPKTAP